MSTDPRLDLPLDEQIAILRDLACDHHPGRRFTRTVPVSPRDHDVVIMSVLEKLDRLRPVVEAAERLQEVAGRQIALGYTLDSFVIEPDLCEATRLLFGALLAMHEGEAPDEH